MLSQAEQLLSSGTIVGTEMKPEKYPTHTYQFSEAFGQLWQLSWPSLLPHSPSQPWCAPISLKSTFNHLLIMEFRRLSIPLSYAWYFHPFLSYLRRFHFVSINFSFQTWRTLNCSPSPHPHAQHEGVWRLCWMCVCFFFFLLKCFMLCGWKVFLEFKAFPLLFVHYWGQSVIWQQLFSLAEEKADWG